MYMHDSDLPQHDISPSKLSQCIESLTIKYLATYSNNNIKKISNSTSGISGMDKITGKLIVL